MFGRRGWNYVECMESIVWGMQEDTGQCWKLTHFCRDVASTTHMDAFGHGNTPAGINTNNMAALGLSLFAGLFATVMIAYAMRGGCSKKDEQYGDVQFTGLSDGASILD
jgi:hypothetical protein